MTNVSHEIAPVAAHVAELARRHGVSYVMTEEDALAEAITRLADDEVAPDETANLIVALRRANVIDGPMMVDLLGNYLEEKYHV